MMNKIKGKFIVEIETDFSDTESDIETARYQLREDLLESGYMNVEVKLLPLASIKDSLPTNDDIKINERYYCITGCSDEFKKGNAAGFNRGCKFILDWIKKQ